MSDPYFSIVIPTKNRAFLLRYALQSLLNQTFEDFEVIVADNDDTDATATLVKSFVDERVRHERTGGLSMPDNWEAGASRAKGRYICMLEDKQALRRRALEQLHRETEKFQPLVIKWQYDKFEDGADPVRLRLVKRDPGGARMISSDELLDLFASDLKTNYKSVLPLPQLGAFHRDLAEKIRSGPTGRLFQMISPDVVSSLLLLNATDEVLDLPWALGVFSSTTHSNGNSSAVRGDLFKRFLQELGITEARLYDQVPLKTVSIPGSIFNDYLHMQEKVGGRLARHPLSWTKFYFEAQRAIWSNAARGAEIADQQEAYDAAFARETENLRESVLQALQPYREQTAKAISRRQSVGHRLGLGRLERRFKAFIRGNILGDMEWKFRDVTEYLEWDAAQSSGDS